jgi:predicted small secreted protein
MVKKVFLIVALIVLCLSLAACQTIAGAGGDIKWSAEKTASILEGE